MQPRIYTYKITFEEVPYYYYGVHKEKVFNEDYWGSPITNKWCWELYTPKKQILEVFDYTDEGWLEANLIEDRLIKPVYQTDKYCLNESCGGRISLQILRKTGKETGKINGKMTYENKIGLFSLTDEEKKLVCSRGGKRSDEINRKNQTGIYALTMEDRIKNGRKGGTISGNNNKKNKTGFCGRSKEKMSEDGRKSGKVGGKVSGKLTHEKKLGIHGLTPEQIKKNASKGGKIVSSQKWKCLVTGFITNAGALGNYQKARGIDTTQRVKVD